MTSKLNTDPLSTSHDNRSESIKRKRHADEDLVSITMNYRRLLCPVCRHGQSLAVSTDKMDTKCLKCNLVESFSEFLENLIETENDQDFEGDPFYEGMEPFEWEDLEYETNEHCNETCH
ncbi:MAG: hypothetical protein P4L69_13080 [Desulfosporosinus sp.]|nr:hypothetical protein [Desulfosporosinus sp.]